MIYLDSAATSWPKPEKVYEAADRAAREYGGNPGRSGHRLSLAAGRVVEEARLLTARLFGVQNPDRVIFTMNTTDSLNLALKGALAPGDHAVTSAMEHNSVSRPLEALKRLGIEYTKVETSPETGADIEKIKAAVRKNTKLMVFTHVSNVTGTVNPIGEIGAFCRERGILLLVDAAQSAGIIPIDVNKMNIDLLAFPGHKGLLGPQGTGGLYIREGVALSPLRQGGTGSHSELLTQPEQLPDRFESGTHNTPGLAGLAAGIRHLLDEGIGTVQKREADLANRLIGGISQIKGITLYGPPAGPERSGVVSLTIDWADTMETALILDNVFDIAVRAGLHCSPDAHRTLGTLGKGGTIRVSFGNFNTEKDVDACLEALAAISAEGSLREAT